MAKRALVTGAAGFIGCHVVRELLAENVEVRCFLKEGESTANLDGLDVEIVRGDVRDPDGVDRAIRDCDRVFHLAGIYALWLPDRKLFYDVNVEGTRTVCRAALDNGVERMVYTSSIASVGIRPGREVSDETVPFNGWKTGNDYVISKYRGEVEALKFVDEGLPLVVVNPVFPFGARDTAPTPTGRTILQLCRGKVPGYFAGGFNAVDVEDLARGHILADKNGRVGERYILGNEDIEYADFYRLVGEVAGMPVRMIKLPTRLAIAGGYVLEAIYPRLTKKAPMSTGRAVKYSAQYLYFDCSKARSELGYATAPLREAVARSIEYYRSVGRLRDG